MPCKSVAFSLRSLAFCSLLSLLSSGFWSSSSIFLTSSSTFFAPSMRSSRSFLALFRDSLIFASASLVL